MNVVGPSIAVVAFFLCASPVAAHSWMIRHGYTNCTPCHLDPSGGGLLTRNGRAQGALLMSSRYDSASAESDASAVRSGRFLGGVVDVPDALLLGGDVRVLGVATHAERQATLVRFLLMQADLQAGARVDRFRAAASVGVATSGALAATVTGGNEARLVSRTHWLGVELGDATGTILLRAGRLNLPFGLRSIEHTLAVRAQTRTDINAAQQHGVALAYSRGEIRSEVMVILGNYQIQPDAYRERGYSAYLEWAPEHRLAIGVSSMLTYAGANTVGNQAVWRHAHGAFFRYSPDDKLVLLGEADVTLVSQPKQNAYGAVGLLQVDVEPVAGLHFIGAVEASSVDVERTLSSFGGWLSVAWFFAPHLDVRIDGVLQFVGAQSSGLFAQSLIGQLHGYL